MIERDNKGRFTKGGIPGPGRPKRAVMVDFHNILIDAVKPEYWEGIIKRAIQDALKGDTYARKFIAEYTIGRPPQILELRAADAALLAELLKRFEVLGMSAGDVFSLMLTQIAETSEVETDER